MLALVAKGLSNAEIGSQLYVSPATLKAHVARILTKLGARDRAELIVIAYKSRPVLPDKPDHPTPFGLCAAAVGEDASFGHEMHSRLPIPSAVAVTTAS